MLEINTLVKIQDLLPLTAETIRPPNKDTKISFPDPKIYVVMHMDNQANNKMVILLTSLTKKDRLHLLETDTKMVTDIKKTAITNHCMIR